MREQPKTIRFLNAEEIISNLADRRFIRRVRNAHAKGKLYIRCQNLQEYRRIVEILLSPLSKKTASAR